MLTTMDSLFLENQQHQPMLNTDMLLTEDFLGLNKEDTESFFNSLSDEDLFSSSSEVSTPQIPSAQPNFMNIQFVDQNNNNGFQFAVANQDPNNNVFNFQFLTSQSNPFGANFTLIDAPAIKQEKDQSRPQSFMILPQTPSTPKIQVPQVMSFEHDSEDSDNDLDMYEPAPKMKRTSASPRGRNSGKQSTQALLPQIPQQAIQMPAGTQTVFVTPKPAKRKLMEKFPEDKLSDFKRVIFNLLVEHHNQCLLNNTDQIDAFVLPIRIQEGEKVRTGFQFNESHGPDKKLPELYAKHIRNAHLEKEDSSSVFIQDLYRFYMRACLELLGKYFDKRGKFTFLYDEETPLFVPGHSLAQAEVRIRSMKTRARMNKKRKSSN